MIFDTYDTALHGWVLTPGWKLSAAEQKTNYMEKASGDGSWDLSTALSDGIPRYRDRTLTATFECSDGDRRSREEKIRHMVNLLDGLRVNIALPDDDFYHLTGRLHVAREYNDPAHAAVTVTAVCDPWKYANEETKVSLTASAEKKVVRLANNGRKAVVPTITVEGAGAAVLLEYGTKSRAFSAGTYQWVDLLLTKGSHLLTYSGTGQLKITYREAVLE